MTPVTVWSTLPVASGAAEVTPVAAVARRRRQRVGGKPPPQRQSTRPTRTDVCNVHCRSEAVATTQVGERQLERRVRTVVAAMSVSEGFRVDVTPHARVLRYQCKVVVRVLDDRSTVQGRAKLTGGHHRRSVGGRFAEGPRWWHGLVELESGHVDAGTIVEIEVAGGRTGKATFEEAGDAEASHLRFRGEGAPPFEVDAVRHGT